MSKSLSELVREQILAEGPQISDGYTNQAAVERARERYIDDQLNDLTNVELLERISDAMLRLVRQ